jgi:hypothetical protein
MEHFKSHLAVVYFERLKGDFSPSAKFLAAYLFTRIRPLFPPE